MMAPYGPAQQAA